MPYLRHTSEVFNPASYSRIMLMICWSINLRFIEPILPTPMDSTSPRPGSKGLGHDLDTRLRYYNTERPHLGYRNQGRRPVETVNLFVSQEG